MDMEVRSRLKRHNGSNDQHELREVVSKLYGLGVADWDLVVDFKRVVHRS